MYELMYLFYLTSKFMSLRRTSPFGVTRGTCSNLKRRREEERTKNNNNSKY